MTDSESDKPRRSGREDVKALSKSKRNTVDMTSQPEALRLARKFEEIGFMGEHKFAKDKWCREAAAELRRLHAENAGLNSEVESLQARVQELGEMARENRSKKVIELEKRIAEMEEQMAAIGAGGVEPLRRAAHTPKDWLAAVPTVNQQLTVPAFTPAAKYKLMSLLSQGFKITGYSIERADPAWTPQRGFVTHGGLVGWWTPHAPYAKKEAES